MYCECGCGAKTTIAKQTDTAAGWKKGEPLRFIQGHGRWESGREAVGKYKSGKYKSVPALGHPRSNNRGFVHEHVLIAEKALGKPLPLQAHIHHYTPEQLVICQDWAYHKLLHQRQRALEACGHASWRKCKFCKEYDDPKNMKIYAHQSSAYHADCFNTYRNQRRNHG